MASPSWDHHNRSRIDNNHGNWRCYANGSRRDGTTNHRGSCNKYGERTDQHRNKKLKVRKGVMIAGYGTAVAIVVSTQQGVELCGMMNLTCTYH